ncbi:MAG: M48 family metalloprotease [Candidatus Omnitrophica bacterium]|nr:M48 family metalloprotease [Candidatus Omnitrophota bacterium]
MSRFRLATPTAFLLLLLSLFAASCASTGPKISKAEKKRIEAEFNAKFLDASENWVPRVYRIGYELISHQVPGHGAGEPKFGFVGIGVEELKDYARKPYGIDEKVKGVLVRGLYPGSKAEGLDIVPGDVIVKLNGKKTKNLGAFFKRVRKAEGNSVKALVWRKGIEREVEVPLEKVYYNAQFFLSPTPDLDANSAFSKINVGIGAIRYCRNDDELATIMGHELAHTTLKHSLKKMGVGVGATLAYGTAAAMIDALTFGGVGNLVVSPMQQATEAAVSRRYEREADYFGLRHAFHSGYDVQNGSKVFSRLATDAPGYNLLAYTFASHPKTSERFLRLEKIVEELKRQYPDQAAKEKSPEWEIVIPVSEGETLWQALEKIKNQSPVASQPAAPQAAAA